MDLWIYFLIPLGIIFPIFPHIWQKTGCKHPHFCNNMPLLPNNMPLSMRLCRGSRFKAEGLEKDFDKTGDAVVDDV